MKTKIIIGVVTLLSAGILAWIFMKGKSLQTEPNTSLNRINELAVDVNNVPPSSSARTSLPSEEKIDYASLLNEKEKEHMIATGHVFTKEELEKLKRRKRANTIQSLMPTMEELKVMEETPVEFYGQVLDQFDQPVVGAGIRCNWGVYGQRIVPIETQSSSPDGRFEILGLNAFSISLSVYPPLGYDEQVHEFKETLIAKAPDRILENAEYKKLSPEDKAFVARKAGADQAYKGDKTKPVIFRLKKL